MVQIRVGKSPASIRIGQPAEVHGTSRNNMALSSPSDPVFQSTDTTFTIRYNQRLNSSAPPLVTNTQDPGVSIIVCTNRPSFMEKVLNNYFRQNYAVKELIVVLNNNTMSLDLWRTKTAVNLDIRVFQLDENKSLGECLNFGISQTTFDYVAKFDDDDYYGPNYLSRQMQAFATTGADIVGKATWYLYFERSNTLAVFARHPENSYVSYVTGATLIIKKEVFNTVKFADRNAGEDVDFVAECKQSGMKIYSTDKADFVGIRRSLTSSHTWQETDEHVLSHCQVVAYTSNYMSWANG